MNNLEELKNLENKINELESKGNNKYKRERGDSYWCFNYSGNPIFQKDISDRIDNFRYSIGNYFETKEQVENYKEKLIIEQELRDIARELNKGEEIDWTNGIQEKYYLYYDFSNYNIGYNYHCYVKNQGTIYCLDIDFRDVAIERIGEERLVKYLKGELD